MNLSFPHFLENPVEEEIDYETYVANLKTTDGKPLDRYSKFLLLANNVGAPTKFLWEIRSMYDISSNNSQNATDLDNNVLYLKNETLDLGLKLDSVSAQSIYHESMHAYLDGMEDYDLEVAGIIRVGEAYYKNAPLESGNRSENAKRLFHELLPHMSHIGPQHG